MNPFVEDEKMVLDLRETILLMIKYKSYDVLRDYIEEHSPIPYSVIAGIKDDKLIHMIRSIKSEDSIDAEDLLPYIHLKDLGYTEVTIPEKPKSYHGIFKMIARCFRGHFTFPSDWMFNAFLKWWLVYVPYIGMKYDWIWVSPSNILHIRRSFYWILNSTLLNYDIAKRLNIRFIERTSSRSTSPIIKLDESAVSFLKGIIKGQAWKKMRTFQYGIMHKSLFDIIVSEHIRVHSLDSPDIRRWSSNYDIPIHRLHSPSLVLSYVATDKPDDYWKSPIFLDDIAKERDAIMYISGL